jgi:hypothetical protein
MRGQISRRCVFPTLACAVGTWRSSKPRKSAPSAVRVLRTFP